MGTEPDMTAPQASFGQTLANAEQTLTATLRRHLAERDTAPETWYALHVIATFGPRLARRALSDRLEGSRTLTPDSTRELLARLEAEGLIHGDAEVDLTAEGEALHASLRDYIAGPTARLLGRFPAADIETTIRTLQAITDRAAAELAEAGQAQPS
jgi:DNA-binding MarR family transcriptional regulator